MTNTAVALPPLPTTEPAPTADKLMCGPLVVDVPNWAATVAGRNVDCTYVEFLLLAGFVRHPNRVQRYAELAAAMGYPGEGDEPSFRARLRTHMARLRRKLAEAGFQGISTVNRVGYRFELPAALTSTPARAHMPG